MAVEERVDGECLLRCIHKHTSTVDQVQYYVSVSVTVASQVLQEFAGV